MAVLARKPAPLLFLLCLLFCTSAIGAADARFDLVGPRIDVRVTRDGVTLPIAAVPNLKAGDRLWIHPDLPATQSVKYLLICVFLRGTTNPPPADWFTRIETWDKHVREEGTFITVPAEAQQALLFMAPETGGDFNTLKSAVQGRPGAFVRAQQDLNEAGFEQARIERYIADIRRVPPSDSAELQKHSELLARTLALKPNADCFKRPPDMQFTCLTQSGSQIVLDDGHGQTIADALNGPTSDLISQASYTQAAGGGMYSAYVGAIVDVVRIMGNLHTAQYQYIPAISFPQAEQMNLRLNTPPSFHNPKSVLVIALPAIQAAVTPPLRAADPNHVACLIEPSVTLPVEGAPLVFSTDFAHDMVLHLNTPAGAPKEPDIPLSADAYYGGLVLQQTPQHHVPLRDPLPATAPVYQPAASEARPSEPKLGTGTSAATKVSADSLPEPVTLTGTVMGRWGFDSFSGPTLPLQQLPGSGWHIVTTDASTNGTSPAQDLIAGHATKLLLASTGTACVHTITAEPSGQKAEIHIAFKQEPLPSATPAADASATAKTSDTPPAPDPAAALKQVLALTLPLAHDVTPGDLHLAIQQYDQPKPDEVSTRTFSEPATIASVELHAGDKSITLTGKNLNEIDHLTLGDLVFSPAKPTDENNDGEPDGLRLALAANAPAPPTHTDEHLTAKVSLRDGRTLSVPVTVTAPRPSLTLLSKSLQPLSNPPATSIQLPNPDDLPLNQSVSFTLKSPTPFPRNGQIEIETLDGTLRAVLTLAPSGGLVLQDPHTVVATLDPLRSFGPSAFGAVHLRAVFPASTKPASSHAAQEESSAHPDPAHADSEKATHAEIADKAAATSNWVPLGTLVRLPTFAQLQCPTDDTQPCTVSGSNLFLVQALSNAPNFADPVAVPDGYTGTTLTVPRATANTLFLHLRDDPGPTDSAIFPAPPVAIAPHSRHVALSKLGKAAAAPPATTEPATPVPATANPTDATPTAAAPKQTGPPTSPGPSE